MIDCRAGSKFPRLDKIDFRHALHLGPLKFYLSRDGKVLDGWISGVQ